MLVDTLKKIFFPGLVIEKNCIFTLDILENAIKRIKTKSVILHLRGYQQILLIDG